MATLDRIYVFSEGGAQLLFGDAYLVWEQPMLEELRALWADALQPGRVP